MLLGMPLLHMKQLTKYIRNVQHFTLDKHPDFTNIDWVQQYLYWYVGCEIRNCNVIPMKKVCLHFIWVGGTKHLLFLVR